MPKRLHQAFFLIFIIALPPAGCCKGDIFQRSEEIMGTVFSVKVWAGGGSCRKHRAVEEAAGKAFEAAREIEKIMSEYRDGSAVSRVNRMAGKKPVKVDDMTWQVIEHSCRIGKETGGAFDITFAPLGKLWNIKSKKPALPPQEKIEEALKLVGLEDLVLDPKEKTVFLKKQGAGIGLGGVAKGYALDRMAAIMEEEGVADYILYGGGDILAGGKKGEDKWQVGIQHPRKMGELLAHFAVDGHWAVATSGDYERFFMLDEVRYHHILDPKTGMPARKCVSVTVMAKNAMPADALATALMVMGIEESKKYYRQKGGFKALIIDGRMNLHRIGDFPKLTMDK